VNGRSNSPSFASEGTPDRERRVHRFKTVAFESPEISDSFDSIVGAVMIEAVAYYNAKAIAASGEPEDAQKFFKHAGTYEGFETWWRGKKNEHRAALALAKKDLTAALKSEGH
jgi:hypothetical protein